MALKPPELTGDPAADATRYLASYGCHATVVHSRAVADEAAAIADRFGLDTGAARTAGWLHDISAVITDTERLDVARAWGLPVLAEEAAFPMILHQKLSAWMALELFGVSDPAILSAIGCHTTLRAGATPLDRVVFVADKIAWDQSGEPPYLGALQAALTTSLTAGACVYLSYLWQQRASLRVVHPWLVDAHRELCEAQA